MLYEPRVGRGVISGNRGCHDTCSMPVMRRDYLYHYLTLLK